jgi:hypothetical protein
MDENYLKTLRILELEPSLSQRAMEQKKIWQPIKIT